MTRLEQTHAEIADHLVAIADLWRPGGRTKQDCGQLGKWLDGIYDAIESGEMVAPFVEQQSPERLTGPKSKLLFNDEGFEEHPDTDAAWLRGRL